MEQALKPSRHVKSRDIVELSFAVPQDQVNMLRQMVMRYILENNDQEVAFRLLDETKTNLRSDIKVWN